MINNPLQMLSMLQNTQNPMALISQMFGNNPKFNQVMQIVQGKTPQQLEQYVRNIYKSQNLDLDNIASQYGFKI